MSRDELAFKILMVILQCDVLRTSVINGEVDEAQKRNREPNFPAAVARVAFIQADAFIEAGVTDAQRALAAQFGVPSAANQEHAQ